MKVNIEGTSAQEIFESVRQLVKTGQLNAGDVLPSVRQLAAQLSVNRNTVSSAYKRLTNAGIALTQGRLGTRICKETHAGEQEGATQTTLFDLADGSPHKAWLPNLNDVARHTLLQQYSYGEVTLLPRIVEYGRQWFSGACPKDFELTLCNGAIDTLERLLVAHLVPGDNVVVEDPCYISSANAIRLAGMQVIGAAVDEYGMRADALHSALKKGAKAVLFTPRAHNPTGASMTFERSKEIREVLSHYPDILVMEDDHFALLAVSAHHSVIPNTTTNWAVFRSVSKGLGPDLRMAFVAADGETVKRLNTRLAPGMSWVSRVLQSMVLTCLTVEQFQQHLALAKQQCAARRNALITALQAQGIHPSYTVDGLNVWVPLHQDCQAVAFALSKKGWLVRPGRSFDIAAQSEAIRVSIQKIDVASAQQFARDIAAII